MTHLWLRAETKEFEKRSPLTPQDCKILQQADFKLTVEASSTRIFTNDEFSSAGCEIVEAGSWRAAPQNAFILGLKELPDEDLPIIHHHIYFAHVYKGQEGAEQLLNRFKHGGGSLFDLEYLKDDEGRRIAAFGHWAGFVGAALAVKAFCHKIKYPNQPFPALSAFNNQNKLIESLLTNLSNSARRPSVLIIGALGRCGKGALDALELLNLEATQWDLQETKDGGPFKEITEHDIFINAALINHKIPPFITPELLNQGSKLSVISDVSCDPNSELNPIPLYREVGDWESPMVTTQFKNNVESLPLEILAVDNLPSVLPRESSRDFSGQLTPFLLQLTSDKNALDMVWKNSVSEFEKNLN